MRRPFLFLTLGALLAGGLLGGCSSGQDVAAPATPPGSSYRIDPFIGSGGFGYAFGSVSVGATAPNGLVKLGPDTNGPWGTINFLHYSGYWYGDDRIRAFSHMHLHGTGATDFGVLGILPVPVFDPGKTQVESYETTFAKASESASPGRYAVHLDAGDIGVELVATPHVGFHRYAFPAGAASGAVILDLAHHIDGGKITSAEVHVVPGESRIRGTLHSVGGMSGGFGGYDVFYEIASKRPWSAHVVWSTGSAPMSANDAVGMGNGAGLALTYDTAGGKPIELAVGLSLVSADGAKRNLADQLGDFDVDATRKKTEAAWANLTDRIQVTGATEAERTTFKTALYHAFLMPTVISDVDGAYRAGDAQTRNTQGFRYVTDLSLWDTYRTLHPLYDLIAPEVSRDVVRSLHAFAKNAGYFPKWELGPGEAGTMIGASAEIVIADAYVKGVTDFDAEGAYKLLRGAAMDPVSPVGGRGGRDHVEGYMKVGYVPSNGKRPSVSLTTEYGNDDFALSELARALGHVEDADALLARSKGYRKLFDPEQHVLRAKKEDGSWAGPPVGLTSQNDEFAEANPLQSVWMAAHDVDGLAQLFGGRDAMIKDLESFFENAKTDWEHIDRDKPLSVGAIRPYYWAANEPDIHSPYMFAQAGRPDLTQKWVRWAMGTAFSSAPDGLPGNDDGGTMSAWFVFSALGFYPLPGSDRYIVGTPLFERAEISVPGGTFAVVAPGASPTAMYVQGAVLNGVPLTRPEFRHSELRAGGSLVFTMGASPSRWGT